MSKSNIPNTRKNHASCVASVAECGEGTVAFFIKANTMSKDPAVLFYTSDFLTGTMFMTDEEVGQYIRLLCAQHQKGHLHPNDVLSICRTETSRVLTKFAKDQDGFYYNERMEVEQEKRKTYCDSRVKNLKRHKAPTAHMDCHMVVHMDNEDVNDNKDGVEPKDTSVSGNILKYFCSIYKDHLGIDYLPSWGKDGAILKGLIAAIGIDETKTLIDRFFDSKDKFITESDHSVGVFKSQVNKLRKLQGSTKSTCPQL